MPSKKLLMPIWRCFLVMVLVIYYYVVHIHHQAGAPLEQIINGNNLNNSRLNHTNNHTNDHLNEPLVTRSLIMDFPTSAAYPTMSYEDTVSLLSEMQRQASEIMDASRDEYEEGYEINMTDDLGTFEISATDTLERSVGVSERSTSDRSRKVKRERGRIRPKSYSKCMDAPLSPHMDVDAPLSPCDHMDTTSPLSIVVPPVGQNSDEAEYEDSILETLSDLANGVDHELEIVKGLLYKVKRERDSYKHSNITLQKSLSEAIASRSNLETQHREALDVILATADDEKKRLKVELKQATESKRKLKKLVSEMIEEKANMEEELKNNADALVAAETKVGINTGIDSEAKLEEERTRHFSALSSAITDLEAKFEADLQEVIKEKDEQMEREKTSHNLTVHNLRTKLETDIKGKAEELEREKRTHNMILKAMEEENKFVREELDIANESLTKLMEEHAKCGDINATEAVAAEAVRKQSQLEQDLCDYSKTIDDLETKLQTESMHTQALISELATKKDELASKDAEIITLERKLSDRSTTYTREYDRMKAHLTKMCNLVESSSADRDRARAETKKLKAEVEKLHAEHKAEISCLGHKMEDDTKEEIEKLKAEVEKRDAEHKAEISRLKHKLEDGTKEMMQHCASIVMMNGNSQDENDSATRQVDTDLLNQLEAVIKERDELAVQLKNMSVSANSTKAKSPAPQSEVLAANVSDESTDEECAHLGDIEKLPNLEDGSDAIKEERDELASKVLLLELELAGLNAQLDLANGDRDVDLNCSTVNTSAIEEERDELASKVRMLESTLAAKNKDLIVLKEKLDVANQEQEIVGTEEQDLCGYTMVRMNKERSMDYDAEAIKQERDQLQSEVDRLEALLEEAKLGSVDNDATLPLRPEKGTDEACIARYEKEIESLQASLDEKKEELVRLEEKSEKLEEELSDFKIKACMYESMERERDNLSAELTTLRATAEATDDVSAAARLGEDLSNLKLEHRVEIKLLKKDHAATKTKVKLLKQELQKIGKEQEEMIKAYDIERQSNAELSSSLEEMVTLLEKERVVHSDQIESLRNKLDSLKFKFSKMRKKRVPIDAAYRATRILLDSYEAVGNIQHTSTCGQLESDGKSASKSSAGSESVLEDIQAALADKEVEINLLKGELDKANSRAAELELWLHAASKNGSDDDNIKAALAEKQVQIEALRKDLVEARSLYDELSQTYCDEMQATREELKAEMSRLHQAHNDSMQAYSDAGNKYEDEITKAKAAVAKKDAEMESLSQQLDDTKAELEKARSHLEIHVMQDEETIGNLNKQVKDERRLQETFKARVGMLEEELESATTKLEEKEAEIELLIQQLNETKDGLDELESQLEFHVQKDGETIERLEQQVSDERQKREVTMQKLESLNSEIDELKVKLASSERHSDELKHYKGAQEQAKAELMVCQGEVEELRGKLTDYEDKLASLDLERNKLLNDDTERQEELKNSHHVIDGLKAKLVEHEENLASLQSECSQLRQANEVANCAQQGYEQEAKNSFEEIELLKKQMKTSEVEFKQRLKTEVDRLKSEFNEVIKAFEAELVDTCESNADALREKSNEITALQEKLTESEERISLFEIQVVELQNKNKEVADLLDKKMTVEVDLAKARNQLADAQALEIALSELKDQHKALKELFEALKEENQELARCLEEAEHSKHQLKGKLHETLVSVEENMQAYNNLRADHNALQQECQVLRGDSSSLHDLVSKLTAEKEKLMNENDKQAEKYQMLSTVKSALEDEIKKHKSHESGLEQLLSTLRDEKENLSSELEENKENMQSLQWEMEGMASDISSKQQQINALQEQSKTANRHLDEMVTYCDKLKTEFAGTSTNLRNELEDQAQSMKEVINALKTQLLSTESEKEENRKMYEKDIETQQAEVETLKRKNAEALNDLDAMSDLISRLKDALEEEKSNSQVLRSQFKESESERKAVMADNEKLQDELTSRYATETKIQERLRNLEVELTDLRPMPDKLTEMMKSESVMRERIRVLESQSSKMRDLETKLYNAQQIETTMRDRIHGLETQSRNLQSEYKNAIKRKEEEGSKLRVVLQECREKLNRLLDENQRLKHDNVESIGSLKTMLNEAIRSRADTDVALQESLQLLEQQKRVDIKRKTELCKLEQTVEILKSKERYLESYVSSLKNQINRGSR